MRMKTMSSLHLLSFSLLVAACQPVQITSTAPPELQSDETLALGPVPVTSTEKNSGTPAASEAPASQVAVTPKYIPERDRVSPLAGYPWDLPRSEEYRLLEALGLSIDLKQVELMSQVKEKNRDTIREEISAKLRLILKQAYPAILESGGRPTLIRKLQVVDYKISTHIDGDTLKFVGGSDQRDSVAMLKQAHRAQLRALKLDGVRFGVRYFDLDATKKLRDDWAEMDSEADAFVAKSGAQLLTLIKSHRALVREILISEHAEPFSYDSRLRTLHINPERLFAHDKALREVLTAIEAIPEALRDRVRMPVQSSVVTASKPRRYTYAATVAALAAIKENAALIQDADTAGLSLYMCYNPKRVEESDVVRPEHSCASRFDSVTQKIQIPVAVAGYRSWADAPTLLSTARISQEIKRVLGPVVEMRSKIQESTLLWTAPTGERWYRPYEGDIEFVQAESYCRNLGMRLLNWTDVNPVVVDLLEAARTNAKLKGSVWAGYANTVEIHPAPNVFFDRAGSSESMICIRP